MANAKAVEDLSTFRKNRKKTNVFWSTVPEDEQFKNVHVPGVSSGAYKQVQKNLQAQKHVQVVQKSKSDSAILITNRRDPLAVNKQRTKTSFKIAAKQNDSLTGQREAQSKGSGDQVANMSGLSESSNSRRASLKNLNVDDKKRVANLIKELAKTGEERELALEKLQEERVSYEERLSTVQQEQNLLKEERESLKERLEESEKLLKKYESEIKEAKREKVFKKFKVQPQSVQTSPLISNDVNVQPLGIKKTLSSETYVLDEHTEQETVQARKSVDCMQPQGSTIDRTSSMASSQVPVYSNSLFDVKVSSVEDGHEESSKPQGVRREDRHVAGTSSMHELYLMEYSLQLRLQEQQIEIQRQQVQLQQQLQLLQQQQGLAQRQQEGSSRQQTHEVQHIHPQQVTQHPHQGHESTQQQEERQNNEHQSDNQQPLSRQQEEEHKKLSVGMTRQLDRQEEDLHQEHHQKEAKLDKKSHQHGPDYLSRQNNETIFKQFSPSQQTNFLQKRTPKRENRHTESQHPLEHSQERSQRQRHNHDHVNEESRERKTTHFYRSRGEMRPNDRKYTPPKGASTPPSDNDFYYLQCNVDKVPTVEEQHTNEYHDKHSIGSTYHHKQSSPRKPHMTDAKHIDINNNKYFQMQSHSLHKDAMMEDHDKHNYLFEPYSESEYQTDDEHCYRSEHPCHCGHYHRRQNLFSEYDHPTLKDSHSKALPQHVQWDRKLLQRKSHRYAEPLFYQDERDYPLDQKSQQRTHYSHLKAESLVDPIETNYHPSKHKQHIDYHQKWNHYLKQAQMQDRETPLLYHHRNEYYQHPHSQEENVLHSPYYTTHQHQQRRKPAAGYPSSKKASKTHGTTERVHLQDQAGSSTKAMLLHQARLREYDYLSSEEQYHQQEDRSKDLLDDYIYNHQTAGEYHSESNTNYDPQENYKKPMKRVISKRIPDKRQREVENLEGGEDVATVPINEDLNPGYSLYKCNTPHGKQQLRTTPGHNCSTHPKSIYLNSLVDIVEDLEMSTGYEERLSEDAEEKAGYDSDEEESSVLDNVFFLKR